MQWRPLGAHWGCSGGHGSTQGASKFVNYKICLHFNVRFPAQMAAVRPARGGRWKPIGAAVAAAGAPEVHQNW